MLIRKKDKRKRPRVNRHNESFTTATTTTTNTSSDMSISTDGRRSIEKVHILETGKTMVIFIDCKDLIDFKAVNELLLPNKTFSRVAVPEPVVKTFPISVEFSGFRMNKNLVKYWEKQEDDLNEQVEYDVDDEDLIWLEEINRDREKRGKRLISQEELSALLDRLEKESYFQSTLISSDTKLKNQVEAIDNINEDAPCSVCLDGECVANNVILFCDMCNLAVHQECYGVPYVPEGQWVCRRCLQSPSTPVSCILCHSNSGAFKQTDKGDWVHVVCAIWVPEVHFANTTFLEPVVGIEKIDRQRWKLLCYICRKPGGACIQCDKSTCYKAFHVTCAQQAGLYMNLHEEVNKKKPNQKQKNNKNKRAYAAESDDEDKENNPNGALMNHSSEEDVDVRKCAYCDVHTPLDAVSPSKLKGVRGNLEEYLKRARKLRMEKARQILTEIQNRPPVINLPAIPQDRIIEISKSFEIEECDQFLDKLISYWKMKRFSRNGVPLVRRFQKSQLKPPSLISTTSEDEEKQAEIERAQIEEFMMLKKLRNDLERVRLLVEMVKKRERIKREQLLIDHLSIKWQCAEANSKFK